MIRDIVMRDKHYYSNIVCGIICFIYQAMYALNASLTNFDTF